MRPSSNREFENHFSAPFPCDVRADAIRIVFLDSAESFIPCTVLRTARAGRSAEDRLLCKQEALGSNPSRSMPYYIGTSGCNQARKRKGGGCSQRHVYDSCRNAGVFRGRI